MNRLDSMHYMVTLQTLNVANFSCAAKTVIQFKLYECRHEYGSQNEVDYDHLLAENGKREQINDYYYQLMLNSRIFDVFLSNF